MTEHEQKMIKMGCPNCGGEIELYDSNLAGDGGKYRCRSCSRDTTWAVGKALSFAEMIAGMKAKIGTNPDAHSGVGHHYTTKRGRKQQ